MSEATMKLTPVKYSFATAAILGLAALIPTTGCVSSSSNNNGTGGTTDGEGQGGTTSTNTSSGGTTTSSSSGGGSSTAVGGTTSAAGAATGPVACLPPKGLITDFTYTPTKADGTASSTTQVDFGDYTSSYSGGTFIYPTTGTYPLTSDVTQSNWHITGTVGDYSGFAFFNGGCTKIDASAFKGISFVISGSVATGTTTANTVTLTVGTAANDITGEWLNAHKAAATDADVYNFGRCTPASANKYDGTCGSPSKTFAVTSSPTTVTVLWADLTGGKPQAGVTPSELTSIGFFVPPPVGVGTASVSTYAVDITLDDMQFVP
jgi:hypothetical protein